MCAMHGCSVNCRSLFRPSCRSDWPWRSVWRCQAHSRPSVCFITTTQLLPARQNIRETGESRRREERGYEKIKALKMSKTDTGRGERWRRMWGGETDSSVGRSRKAEKEISKWRGGLGQSDAEARKWYKERKSCFVLAGCLKLYSVSIYDTNEALVELK